MIEIAGQNLWATDEGYQLAHQIADSLDRLAPARAEPPWTRNICRDDLVDQIHSIKEGDLIKVVPEHECEFYTDKPK